MFYIDVGLLQNNLGNDKLLSPSLYTGRRKKKVLYESRRSISSSASQHIYEEWRLLGCYAVWLL
jgi:hypothetical protein